jgi:hypothetical protein
MCGRGKAGELKLVLAVCRWMVLAALSDKERALS